MLHAYYYVALHNNSGQYCGTTVSTANSQQEVHGFHSGTLALSSETSRFRKSINVLIKIHYFDYELVANQHKATQLIFSGSEKMAVLQNQTFSAILQQQQCDLRTVSANFVMSRTFQDTTSNFRIPIKKSHINMNKSLLLTLIIAPTFD